MSQAATLYRISADTFLNLVNSDNNPQFDIASAKDHATFQGSFMGLEFVLSKGKDAFVYLGISFASVVAVVTFVAMVSFAVVASAIATFCYLLYLCFLLCL